MTMERRLRFSRLQASCALWGGVAAYMGVVVFVLATVEGFASFPLTSLAVILVGAGLRGEASLFTHGIAPGFATVGLLLAPLAGLALLMDWPALAAVVALAASGFPFFLMRAVWGGSWMSSVHRALFAAPSHTAMQQMLEHLVEEVRTAHPTPLPGGYTFTFSTTTSLMRINGSSFKWQAQVAQAQDADLVGTTLGLLDTRVKAALGQRAWPQGRFSVHVREDSAHQKMARAAQRARMAGTVALVLDATPAFA